MGWREFKITPPVDYVDKEDYVKPKLVLNPHNPHNPPVVSKKLVDEHDVDDISHWLDRVIRAGTTDDVLAIVESFRPLSWTDQERSRMSRTYIARIDSLTAMVKEPPPSEPTKPAPITSAGPRVSKWEQYRRAAQDSKAKRLQEASGGWWAND